MLCYITTDSWLLVMCSDWCRSHISCVRHCSLSYRCSHYRLQTLQVMFSLTHLYHSSSPCQLIVAWFVGLPQSGIVHKLGSNKQLQYYYVTSMHICYCYN